MLTGKGEICHLGIWDLFSLRLLTNIGHGELHGRGHPKKWSNSQIADSETVLQMYVPPKL